MDDLPLNTIGFQDKSQKALNGAVLKFEPKNGFMRASLQEFLHNFNNRYWGANGPELLTRVFFSSPESWNLTTVSPYFFQYFSFQRIKQDCYQDVRDYKVLHRMNGIRSKAYVVHLNNQLAVTIVNGSTCDCLENTFCISETCSLKDRCRPLLEKPMQAPLTTGVDYLDKMVSTDMLSLPEDAYYSSRTSVAHQMSLKIFVYNLTDLPEYMQYDNSITLATQEALVKLFATFQGRTFNASVADFFIIPFVWASVSCANCTISNTHPKEVLQYYSMNPSRHLFFLPERSEYSAKIKSYSDTDIDKTISIDLPPFNPHPAFQPAAISHRSVTWWNKSRKYSLVASDVSGDDYNMSNTFHLFINHVKDWKTVGGLPFLLVHSTEVDLSDMVNYLQNSFFCPCFFEEDATSFQRFFDAILSGCIPVMPDYLMEKIEFLPFSSYIPYHEFVLEVNATTIGEGSMIEAIKNTIQNHTDLEHRQSRLREYAVTVSYGMGRDAHGFHDAFAQLVNTLEEKQAS